MPSRRFMLLSMLSLCLVPAAVAGQERPESSAIALRYLEALYALDFESVGGHLADDAVFRDPTAASLTGAALELEGREAIVAGFEDGAAGLRNTGFEVERSFETGEYVVFSLIYRAELKGENVGIPGAWVPVEVPSTTVLRIVDGEVAEHLDHVAYDEMLRQIGAFSPAPRSSPVLQGSSSSR